MENKGCIRGENCSETQEVTCCYECAMFKVCTIKGYTCDDDSCEKYPKETEADLELPSDEPCECPYCIIESLEEDLADVLDELVDTQRQLIEAQREIIRLSGEPKIWQ